MDILEIAINKAGGVGKLAAALGVSANVVSNWRLRSNLPLPWEIVLRYKYAKSIKAAKTTKAA